MSWAQTGCFLVKHQSHSNEKAVVERRKLQMKNREFEDWEDRKPGDKGHQKEEDDVADTKT